MPHRAETPKTRSQQHLERRATPVLHISYPMSAAGWLPLDLNGESPVQRTASPQSSLKASRSTRRAVRFRRGALLLLDPLQPDQLVTVENADQTAGSALGVGACTRPAWRHYVCD